jgi:predicted carbohydrate-binding protein with CBM5 and CBM33 domain
MKSLRFFGKLQTAGRMIQRHITLDWDRQNHRREDFKFYQTKKKFYLTKQLTWHMEMDKVAGV